MPQINFEDKLIELEATTDANSKYKLRTREKEKRKQKNNLAELANQGIEVGIVQAMKQEPNLTGKHRRERHHRRIRDFLSNDMKILRYFCRNFWGFVWSS